MATRKRVPRKPREGERKRDATRRKLQARALALFQKRGVEATTMRDIAKAAGLSLGAAYYYFPSKEALVFAYYEDNQAEAEEIARRASGTPRERLGTMMHAKLEAIRPHKKMLAAIVQRLVDPSDPVGAFSTQSRAIRERSIALFADALEGAQLPREARALAARALWLFQLAAMLLFVHDESPGERMTHGLVDDALDMVVPLLPMLATPMGQALTTRVIAAFTRAGIAID